MLADMNLILPIRESASEMKAKRQRQDRVRIQKVLPRRGSDEPMNQDENRRPKGNSLNAYV